MGCSNSLPSAIAHHPPFLTEQDKKFFGSNAAIRSKFEHRYDVIKKVSEGLTKVYMVTKVFPDRVELSADDSRPDLGVLVMQVIDLTAATPQIRNSMETEIVRMQQLHHRNILRIFDVHIEDDKIAIVTELCIGEDLESAVPYNEAVAKSITKQIVEGVGHMHANGHFGHDLSTENILFTDDSNEQIKISFAGLPVVSAGDDVSKDLAKKAVRAIGGITYRLLTGNDIVASKTPPSNAVLFDENVQLSGDATDFVTTCLACRKNFDIYSAAKHAWLLEDAEASLQLISVPAEKQKKEVPVEEMDTTMESSYDSMDAIGVCDISASASHMESSAFASEDIMADTSMLTGNSEVPPLKSKPKRKVKSLSEKLEEEQQPQGSDGGSLSPAELKELRDVFLDLQSTKSDGEVTVKEVKEIFARRKTGYTEEEVAAWFQADKFDDSRNIKYTEFLDEAIRSRRKLERDRPEDTFQQFDKGSRGFMTVGNLRALLGTSNSEQINQLIKEASKKDGTVTFDRFEEVFSRFNSTDTQ